MIIPLRNQNDDTLLQYGFFAYTLQAYASQITKQVVFLVDVMLESLHDTATNVCS